MILLLFLLGIFSQEVGHVESSSQTLNNTRIPIRVADCSNPLNTTLIRNDRLSKCVVSSEPTKFYPVLAQIIQDKTMYKTTLSICSIRRTRKVSTKII